MEAQPCPCFSRVATYTFLVSSTSDSVGCGLWPVWLAGGTTGQVQLGACLSPVSFTALATHESNFVAQYAYITYEMAQSTTRTTYSYPPTLH